MVPNDGITELNGSDDGTAAVATYTFRWDVEVPAHERRYGQKFMRQWKRVLQAQKLTPLVSAHLSPCRARFQLCVSGEADQNQVLEHEAAVVAELSHLRWAAGAPPERCIEGDPAGTHPSGWEGVRVWMTFGRQDVEAAFVKKARV